MPPKPSGRPRGRPSKAGGVAKPAATTPSDRPRGRPRKSEGAVEPEAPATPSARARGRPRKSDAIATPAALAKPATPGSRQGLRARLPKPVAPAPQPSPAARPRGRPVKTATAPAGRPRGRPPKAATTGRPRGRPPKNGAAAKATPTTGTTRVAKSSPKAKKASPSFNLLKSAIGSYDVTCEDISGNWGNAEDTYTLNISNYEGGKGLVGDFDFNIIEGTMIFADSQAGLDQLVGSASTSDESNGAEGDVDEPEEPEESEEPKAKRGRPAKAKTETKLSRRLLLQWRGRDTSEGQIHYDNASNAGYIEFTDNECSKFKGVASFPAVGEKVAFEGVRVGGDPGNTATPWSEFSRSAYDEANQNRWN